MATCLPDYLSEVKCYDYDNRGALFPFVCAEYSDFCNCPRVSQGYEINQLFKIYTPLDRLPPFFFAVPKSNQIGCSFCIELFKCGQAGSTRVNSSDIPHKVYSNGTQHIVVYNGEAITQGLTLEKNTCYFLRIGGFQSPQFWATDVICDKLKVTLSNSKSIAGVPYILGFKQYLYLDGCLCSPKTELYQETEVDERFEKRVFYQKATLKYSIDFQQIWSRLATALSLINFHDEYYFEYKGIKVKGNKLTKVEQETVDCCYSNVNLSVEDLIIAEDSLCEVNEFVPVEVSCANAPTTNPCADGLIETNEELCVPVDCEDDEVGVDSCVNPSCTLNVIQPSCDPVTGDVISGKIRFSSWGDAVKIDYFPSGTYLGSFNTAYFISSLNGGVEKTLADGLPNTNSTYTIRLFKSDVCYTDFVIQIFTTTCLGSVVVSGGCEVEEELHTMQNGNISCN